MKHTQFHNYHVSQLVLGTIQLGMDYGIANTSGAPGEKEVVEILDYARSQGINTFDTARTYGEAERRLGSYFHDQNNREDLIITKFKYDWFHGITTEQAWAKTKASVLDSLNCLNTTQIPLLMYHKGPDEPMDEVLRIVPVLVERLIDEGYISHAGISLNYSAEANELPADPVFEAIQIPLNLLDQQVLHNGALSKLHDSAKMIFVRSIFLQGLFFKQPEELTGVLAGAISFIKTIQTIAEDYRISVADLAFAFIRDLPQADSLVVGAENKAQIAANISLLQGPRLSETLRAELTKSLTDIPKEIYTPGLWRGGSRK